MVSKVEQHQARIFRSVTKTSIWTSNTGSNPQWLSQARTRDRIQLGKYPESVIRGQITHLIRPNEVEIQNAYYIQINSDLSSSEGSNYLDTLNDTA